VEHPEARRWGFQLTARLASDETRPAGTFTITDEVRVRCDDGSAMGGDGPCNGTTEFAEHTSTSNRLGQMLMNTWEVEWTPPATDVGEVIFYVAGNAADGNQNNQNDRIYTSSHRIGTCRESARPTIRSVVHGATFQPGGAPLGMVTIFGSNFPNMGRSPNFNEFESRAFPRQFGCMAVEIGGRRAPITYLQHDQINVQVPADVPAGPAEVRVIANPGRGSSEMRSDASTVQIARYAPAWFIFPQTRGIAATLGDGTLIGDNRLGNARAARPGEVVSLYGTGFGAVDRNNIEAGQLSPPAVGLRDPFTVTVGGMALRAEDVQFSGLAPNSITALYQFNVQLPASLADGDVPIVVTIGGISTPTATIPVRR
jgi:uncharacterized protein (TIGR03437 family)